MKSRVNVFDTRPSINKSRTINELSHGVKTTMNVGYLYPLDIQEVLPGDTFQCKVDAVARITSSFIKPVIDNAYLDLYHFFVPLRLCYKDAENVFGVASPSSYYEDNYASMPITPSKQTVSSGSIADYLGLPLGDIPKGISIAPFRAFALIKEQWFRNQNTEDEIFVQTGDFSSSELLNNNDFSPNNYTGKLPKVSKKKDYFTACLPAPQKGPSVNVPFNGISPVQTRDLNAYEDGSVPNSLYWGKNTKGAPFIGGPNNGFLTVNSTGNRTGSFFSVISTGQGVIDNSDLTDFFSGSSGFENYYSVVPRNLFATMDGVGVNVNDLRLAFALQRYMEVSALFGSRYNEYILAHYGVSSPDARLQFTEYLGGGRIPISIQQVAQTSQSTESSPLANVGGYSLTNGRTRFSKGFVEHGYLLTVGCIRTLHTYQQGIPKMFMRQNKDDFYDPLFAHLGEQPVWETELYVANADGELKEQPFGYNEAWAEYRYAPSKITGELRSGIDNSLDVWHFGDYYSNAPTLTENFTNETDTNINRTLSVPSSSQDNFLVDLWFNMRTARVMPLYSTPSGLGVGY